MLIRRAEKTPGKPMAMEGAAGVEMRMMVGRDDGAPNFAMRHFTVGPGGHSPRHQHNYEHEVFVLEGQARVEQDDDEVAGGLCHRTPHLWGLQAGDGAAAVREEGFAN